MQQDWRRDPIWQLLGIIISVIIVLAAQFNELVLKIIIVGVGIITCIWIYLGNKKLVKLFRHIVVITILRLLLTLLLLLLCAILFFFSFGLFLRANALWEKLVTGAGSILAFSVFTALYHHERPIVANVFKWFSFLTGIVGLVLVFVVDNPWIKVALAIVSLLIEIVAFIFSAGELSMASTIQKTSPSHPIAGPENNRLSENP